MPLTRREFLARTGGGFGAMALSAILGEQSAHAMAPHHPPRARAVIQLFMLGGASQCDTFDYKPSLQRRNGEKVAFPVSGGTVASPGPVLGSPWEWKQHGQCGRWVSSAMPHIAHCVDDLAFLMAM